MGPIKFKDFDLFSHEKCILWNSDLKNTEINKYLCENFENLKKTSCLKCGKKNAGIKCYDSNCKTYYHYKCLINSKDLQIEKEKKCFYCTKHMSTIGLKGFYY